jgi:hypothetical protein
LHVNDIWADGLYDYSVSFAKEDLNSIAIDNKMFDADLFVQYYILNPDLAYVSLWGAIDAISFTFAKKRGKWMFFDYSIRKTR